MDYLVDTNVIARWCVPLDPLHSVAVAAAETLRGGGHQLFVAAQNLIEFRGFATRPAGPPTNGFGMSAAQADSELQRIRSFFLFLPDTPAIYPEWERLVAACGVMGRQVHDARLAAVMRTYGLSHLLTFNASDFARYGGLETIAPESVR